MNSGSHPAHEYQVGGSLPPDYPYYVSRKADQDLYEGLKAGKFCYVLNSRQMGKSSLRVQIMRQLQNEGIACAAVDLTNIGSQNLSVDQWYAGFVRILVSNFKLSAKLNLGSWWRIRDQIPPLQRLSEFIEEVLLAEISQQIVIFMDEIDSVLSLNFKTDDFFALIRYCYNQRADKPEYQRLTFTLLGVATPSDLIQDKQRTPFNIGQAIELNGFQQDEAEPLAKGLVGKVSNPEVVLGEILVWTGGQPFLTQKLCQIIQTSDQGLSVEEVVQSRIIENWESQDEQAHLKTIRDRLLRNEQRAGRLLGLYQQILQQGEVTADGSPEQIELRLSGLVVEKQSKLTVYNQIYKSVFNQNWVDKALADLRPYAEAITAWFISNCKDESRLLRGKALQDAQQWAEDKNLSNDDYQFLNASQAFESRLYQEALKSHTFRFKNGEASSLLELIYLCDKYLEEAADYLFNNDITQWLRGQGRTDLANVSRKIINSYFQEKRKGLEIFVRELCQSERLYPYPKVVIQPDILDFGENPVGYQTTVELQIWKHGRGFAWGFVEVQANLRGVTVPKRDISISQDSGSSTSVLIIQLNTLAVKPGNYEGDIAIHLEGIEPYFIHLKYTVINIEVRTVPRKLDLGDISRNKDLITVSFSLICETLTGRIGGRIQGIASNKLTYIEINPLKFEGELIFFEVTLNPKSLEVGQYEDLIVLETSAGEIKLPVIFNKFINWDEIIIYSVTFASFTGILMWIIRTILKLIYSDNIWFLSYMNYVVSSSCHTNTINTHSPSFSRIIAWIVTSTIIAMIPSLRHIVRNIIKRIIDADFDNTIVWLSIYIFSSAFFISSYADRFSNFLLFLSISMVDIPSYSFTWFNIKDQSLGWLFLGSLLGVMLSIILEFRRIKKYNYVTRAIIIAITTFVILSLIGWLTPKTNICYV